ncbi:SDR family oxidoreductase [Rhodococcus koreensis]|uniref:SDR family oxidoreductase n=1 Tax=Rhodococcus koreensis TaxID=99653 RepID=UPI00366C95C1
MNGPWPGGGTLEGAGVLITGGASGIGAAAARRLAAAGAKVAVVDVAAGPAQDVAAEVGGYALVGDVADPAVMPRLVAQAEALFGRLDLVFLNAGVVAHQSGTSELDLADYRKIVGVNVDHVVYGTSAAVPALRRAGGGTIIATASLGGLVPIPSSPLYTLTKHAVVGYVRAAGAALADDGIRMCALCPGFANTRLITDRMDQFADFPMLSAEDVADAMYTMLDRGQPGEAWYVQPGRDPGPYGFRGVPGPIGGVRPPRLTSR